MTFDMDDFDSLDPNNPLDQDLIEAVSAAISTDQTSLYPGILELVRHYGSKEVAYEAVLKNQPDLPDSPYALRTTMALMLKAEREIRASN